MVYDWIRGGGCHVALAQRWLSWFEEGNTHTHTHSQYQDLVSVCVFPLVSWDVFIHLVLSEPDSKQASQPDSKQASKQGSKAARKQGGKEASTQAARNEPQTNVEHHPKPTHPVQRLGSTIPLPAAPYEAPGPRLAKVGLAEPKAGVWLRRD